MIKANVEDSKSFLGSGLVLTGGGCEIPGLSEFLSSFLPYDVVKIRPTIPTHLYQATSFSDEKIECNSFDTRFATVLGLLYLEFLRLDRDNNSSKGRLIHQYFQKTSWMD